MSAHRLASAAGGRWMRAGSWLLLAIWAFPIYWMIVASVGSRR